jgi:putative CocE/NonD family hydrolase
VILTEVTRPGRILAAWLFSKPVLLSKLAPLLGLVLAGMLASVLPACQQLEDPAAEVAPVALENFSEYVAMPDGVLLAVEVYLPPRDSREIRIPALIEFTRYWRAFDQLPPATDPGEQARQGMAAGYAYVIVDVRGSGASQGVRKAEFSLAEARDMPFVIDWVSQQPWSNGKVATMGYSYPGNTAEMAALFPGAALVAAVPRFTDFDWYSSIVLPGGLMNEFIAVRWGAAVRKMDLNDASLFNEHSGEPSAENPLIRGVRPVSSDSDGSILAAASKQHEANASLADQLATLVYRDEYPLAEDLQDSGAKATSIHMHRERYEQNAVPMYQWGSWFDAGTAAGILARFAQWETPYRYIIGAWSHGARHDANPYAAKDAPPQPSVDQQFADIFAFLDPLMKGEGKPTTPLKELLYYTVGENVWKTTRVWPPEGQVMEAWYFAADQSLSTQPPQAINGYDEYPVDFSAGSGTSSRWATQLGGGDVYYGDRAEADLKLLSYTSAPLAEDLELTGSPVISLRLSSTHTDGAVIAYLESVAPDGIVSMLTEGQLRLLHRAVSEEPEFETFGPFHSFERKDGKPMVPGEVSSVSFALLPVSVRIPKGHAIRVALAGHDKDTFIRVPDTGQPVLRIYRQTDQLSSIALPVIRNAQ